MEIKDIENDIPEQAIDEMILYIDMTFKNESATVTLRNIEVSFISKFNSKIKIIMDIMSNPWYMNGLYDKVILYDCEFTIINQTKTKIELVRSN